MLFGLMPEQEELQLRARSLADAELRPRAARVDQTEEFPLDNVQTLVRERFMGLTIPSQHGGGGRPVLDAVLVIEQIARACGMPYRFCRSGRAGAAAVRASADGVPGQNTPGAVLWEGTTAACH